MNDLIKQAKLNHPIPWKFVEEDYGNNDISPNYIYDATGEIVLGGYRSEGKLDRDVAELIVKAVNTYLSFPISHA